MKHTSIRVEDIIPFAKEITIEAGKFILETLQNEHIQVEFKSSATDLVTQVDREVERRLIESILERYPQHSILGEEGVAELEEMGEYTWIIDPIDGTTNFVHQKINYCVSVALYKGNEGLIGVVYDPSREELFWGAKGHGAYLNGKPLIIDQERSFAESLICTNMLWVKRTEKWGLEKHIRDIARRCRGIRALGAAALEMAYVAAGRIDGFLSLHLSPWDFAASKVIVEEAGGTVKDFNGESIRISREKFGLIACRPNIYPSLYEILSKKDQL